MPGSPVPRPRLGYVAALALLLLAPVAIAQQQVRVATYNIKFLKATVSDARAANLKQVIATLDADVIGLQEIDDRDALEKVFDKAKWDLVIDDQSGDDQDVALAVRHPFKAKLTAPGLDAEDADFLFSGAANNNSFPNRRDLLCIHVEVPTVADPLFVMVHHAKARVGANRSSDRNGTDPRREEAARKIVTVLEQSFDGKRYVLLGDMNDNPDDTSMNILETGMPAAPGGPEEIAGPFLVNLTEALVVEDRVSWGLKASNVVAGKINTVKAGSRQKNNERGSDGGSSPILFDQLLIPVSMGPEYVAGSCMVFDDPVAVLGGPDVPSDHVPVFADFVIGGGVTPTQPVTPITPTAAPSLAIVEVLPNPDGDDRGKEEVVLANSGTGPADLTGWKLRDRSGNTHELSGTIQGQARLTVTLPAGKVPLNNDGDQVLLLNPDGGIAHSVTYTASQVHSGQRISFP